MQRITLVCACLALGLMAVAALSASSASASTAWFECSEVSGTGGWKNETCSEADGTKKSNFERVEIAATGVSGHSLEAKFEVATNTITCKEIIVAGEVEAAGLETGVKIKMFGCKGEEKTTKKTCAVKSISPAGGTEEIQFNALKGELGKVSKTEASSEVGLLVQPVSGAAMTELEGSCLSSPKLTFEGSLISEVSPSGKVQTTSELIAAAVLKKQKIQKFEGGSQKVMKAGGAEKPEVAYTNTTKITFERAEIGAGEQVQPPPPRIYGWRVKGADLAAGQTRTITVLKANVGGMTIQGKVGATAFTVKCTTLTETGGTKTELIGGQGASSEMTWTLTGCTMPTPANCQVENEKIVTKNLGVAVGAGLGRSAGKTILTFGSNEGGAPSFMTIEAKNNGGTCGVAGNITVEGSVLAEALDPGTELFTQEFSFEPMLKTGMAAFIINRVRNIRAGLTVGAEEVTISGILKFKVTEVNVGEVEFAPK